jgi:hypothetical protein
LIAVTLQPDLSVDVTLTGSLNGATPPAAEPPTTNVRTGQVWTVPEFSLDDGDTFPDRAYFRTLTVTNLSGPGY